MSTELFLTKLGAWTLDDLAQLPDDGRRYEIIDGSLLILVSPPPSNYHQGLAFDSVARLVSHRHPLGLATVNRRRARCCWGRWRTGCRDAGC